MKDKIAKVKALLHEAVEESKLVNRSLSIAVYANFVKGKKLDGKIEAFEHVLKILEETDEPE